MPHVHARGEAALELPDELPEVHALFGGEIAGQPTAIPLPLGVRDLHVELLQPDEFDRRLPHGVLVHAQTHGGVDLVCRRQAYHRGEIGVLGRRLAVRRARLASGGKLTGVVDAAEILAALDLHDHRRLEWRRRLSGPGEECASIALEFDLDQLRRDGCGGHSWNAPILRYFSRRRRTSLSGFNRRSSSMCLSTVSCTAVAVSA